MNLGTCEAPNASVRPKKRFLPSIFWVLMGRWVIQSIGQVGVPNPVCPLPLTILIILIMSYKEPMEATGAGVKLRVNVCSKELDSDQPAAHSAKE